ncbi:MAG: hypothetical protein RQ723_00570 [Desulfuromonadales bacterium]|nr:hypothetical protein [Desulfuromonadales bacterium]
MTFKQAVEAADPPVNGVFQPGLQALGQYSRKVTSPRKGGKMFTGSIDLDGALAKLRKFATANRWDYGIGYLPVKGRECAVWVEVHGAKDKEVGTLARKAKWLKDYLRQHAPDLWTLTLASPEHLRFVWLGTKNVQLPKNSPAYRRAAQEGITLHGTELRLP